MAAPATLTPAPGVGTALLERDDALARLRMLLAASAKSGRVVAISGEAGVGKTTLVEALAEHEAGRASFLWGGCEALDTPRPLGPLLDMSSQLDDEFGERLRAGNPLHDVFATFAETLGRRSGAMAVVFEDVHWADEATLD